MTGYGENEEEDGESTGKKNEKKKGETAGRWVGGGNKEEKRKVR